MSPENNPSNSAEVVLSGLNPAQKEAAAHTNGPLMILAGAGAGKTKTITHRIAHLVTQGVAPDAILAVTFTNKAASEMRDRIRTLLRKLPIGNLPISAESDGRLPFVSTFHALGVRILREFASHAGLPRSFVIWDRDDSIRAIKTILKDLGLENQYTPRNVLGAVSRKKGDGVHASLYAETAQLPFEKIVAETWRRYENALNDERALDFDDLLLRTLTLLQDNRLRAHLCDRWTHITIDEYQDTNRAQYEIARLLAGDRANICVVGDVDQNIYSWRGADISHLLTFEDTYPRAKTVLLEQNYRSTSNILEAANAVIAKNTRRKEKNLFTENGKGELIEVKGGHTESDEAQYIAATSAELIGASLRPMDIAVLYRENFQSRALEEAFLHTGIPYRVLGVRFFDRKEVKDTLSYIRFSQNPESKADLARIIAVPARGIGAATLARILEGKENLLGGAARAKVETFRNTVSRIRDAVANGTPSEAVRITATLSGMEDMYRAEGEEGIERIENIRELAAFASRYDALPFPEGIERLLEDAALASEQDSLEKRADAVSLMTVHASKGLEFDAVFITGLEHGLFPSTRESEDRDHEEERRLFYVAVTRAKRRLFLTYAMSRMKYGSREFTLPSEFLDDVESHLVKGEMSAPPRKRGILDWYEEETIR